jgi:hypothetical protein
VVADTRAEKGSLAEEMGMFRVSATTRASTVRSKSVSRCDHFRSWEVFLTLEHSVRPTLPTGPPALTESNVAFVRRDRRAWLWVSRLKPSPPFQVLQARSIARINIPLVDIARRSWGGWRERVFRSIFRCTEPQTALRRATHQDQHRESACGMRQIRRLLG